MPKMNWWIGLRKVQIWILSMHDIYLTQNCANLGHTYDIVHVLYHIHYYVYYMSVHWEGTQKAVYTELCQMIGWIILYY